MVSSGKQAHADSAVSPNVMLPAAAPPRITVILSLIASGALTQALQLCFYPVITRLYQPADFGDFLLYSSLTVILLSVATLKLDAAILAGRQADAAVLRRLATTIILVFGAISSLAFLSLWALADQTVWANGKQMTLLLVPLGLCAQGLYALAFSHATREKRYRALAASQIAVSASALAIQIIGGLSAIGLAGLIAGDIVSRCVGIAVLRLPLRHRGLSFSGEKQRFRAMWRRYSGYPRMLAPAALLNSIGQQIQNLLFPLLFGAGAAGQFALATRVLSAPIGLTSKAIGNVFSGEAASQRNDVSALRRLTLHVLGLTTGTALPMFVCAALMAPSAFAWLFGADWREAGIYAAILAAGLSASLVASPLSSLITLRDSLHTAIYFSGLEILVRSLPFLIGAALQSERLAIILLSIGNVVLYIVALVRFLRLAHMNVIDYLRHTRKILLLALASFTPAFALNVAGAGVAMQASLLLPGLAAYGFGLSWYWRKGEI